MNSTAFSKHARHWTACPSSEYLLAEIRRSAERPTLRELRERLHQRRPVVPDVSPAEVIRELRDQP
jgi:hypothetical protein